MKRNVFNIRFFYFLVCLLPSLALFAQEDEIQIRKAALIIKIAQEFQWNLEPDSTHFVLTLHNAPTTFSILQNAGPLNVAGKPVKLLQSQGDDISFQSNAVYINSPSPQLHARLFSQLQGKGVLLISSESSEIVSSMINVYHIDRNLGFSVNRPNLEAEGFGVSKRLLELGGTELESATIYKEVIKGIAAQRQWLDDLQTELVEAEAQFKRDKAAQDMELKVLQQDIQEQERQLQKSQHELVQSQSALQSSQSDLQQSQHDLQIKQAEIQSQTQKLDEILSSLQRSQEQIQDAEQALEIKQSEIRQTESLLQRLSNEIASQQTTLAEQKDQLGLKDELLASQQDRFYFMMGFISLIALAMFVVVHLWVRNRKANLQLSRSLAKLEKAKNQLVEAEKFAALGQLVAGVAHELNTPIGVSITSSSAMSETLGLIEQQIITGKVKKSVLLSHLENMKAAQELTLRNLSRAGNLIQSFKQVAADQSMSGQREIELLSYLEEILQTLDITLKKQDIDWDIKGEAVKSSMDPGQFAQVVQNLVLNCQRHAFTNIDNPNIKIYLSHDDNQIYLTIKDNGVGMEASVRDKICEPFYTTARGSGGTGLGMHIVYNLVTQSFGGTLKVESQPGKGTSFLICLPRE